MDQLQYSLKIMKNMMALKDTENLTKEEIKTIEDCEGVLIYHNKEMDEKLIDDLISIATQHPDSLKYVLKVQNYLKDHQEMEKDHEDEESNEGRAAFCEKFQETLNNLMKFNEALRNMDFS